VTAPIAVTTKPASDHRRRRPDTGNSDSIRAHSRSVNSTLTNHKQADAIAAFAIGFQQLRALGSINAPYLVAASLNG
jgi:hypothetical protein